MSEMIRPYNNWSGYGPFIDYTRIDKDINKQVREEVAILNTQLKQKGLEVTGLVTSGFDAASEIEKVCKKNDIDLIIMSTHGRSGLDRWLMGSVAEKVLRYGEVPLLLINARAN
jgi:nucleotide-binding universal stress UspA family protein